MKRGGSCRPLALDTSNIANKLHSIDSKLRRTKWRTFHWQSTLQDTTMQHEAQIALTFSVKAQCGDLSKAPDETTRAHCLSVPITCRVKMH